MAYIYIRACRSFEWYRNRYSTEDIKFRSTVFAISEAIYIYEQMVYCAYPDKELVFKKKLSDQIIDLMKFFTGRTFLFKKDLTCNDDWNKLIWDLIRISGVSTYNRRLIGRVGESRRVIYGESSLFDELNENLYIREDSFGDSFGEGAVSCLMIYAKEIKEGNW
mgnify:CR=1 FL=1|jgi:hypothetical protein